MITSGSRYLRAGFWILVLIFYVGPSWFLLASCVEDLRRMVLDEKAGREVEKTKAPCPQGVFR